MQINSLNETYKSLGPFSIACIYCGALHFPEERVGNKGNSFGDCCLHGRIAMSPPQFQNELVCLFLGRHLPSEEFHKQTRNLNLFFALDSFNVSDDRTINGWNIFSFKEAGEIYHKITLATEPSQTTEGEI
jgi:hypothetical protein